MLEHKILIPKNKRLKPFIDFKLSYDGVFYGFNSADLFKFLPKLAEKDDNTNKVATEDS